MTSGRPVWQDALLACVDGATQRRLEPVLDAESPEAVEAVFTHWMDRYREAELARPIDELVGTHEFGGHLRPLFAGHHVHPDPEFIEHCRQLFARRREWVEANQFHGYTDGNEVHHDPEAFLYFQIPLLDLTGDPAVLAAVEDVASMAGNWAPGVPDWYDWATHGFRSTWLGSREVRAAHPDDYQEANHWRIIALVLAAQRHGAGGGRYLELARDYAERWCDHIEGCVAAGEVIAMQILPSGATRVEMGHAGARTERLEPGVYSVFYRLTAANTAYDVAQGLQDVYRLSGDERALRAAGAILDQYRAHTDPVSGRWPVACSQGEWTLGLEWSPPRPPLEHGCILLASLALRQEALDPNPERRQALVRWAEAALAGTEVRDGGSAQLLFAAYLLTGDVRFRTEGLRRVTAGLVATFDDHDRYHCCAGDTREGYGMLLEMPWLVQAGLVENGTRGSWPLALAGAQ